MLKKSHDHLESVHENYVQHLCFAVLFGLRMIGAGMAAILHGLCPAIFQKTGSGTVHALHETLIARRSDRHDGGQ